jgi:hypothetical protein
MKVDAEWSPLVLVRCMSVNTSTIGTTTIMFDAPLIAHDTEGKPCVLDVMKTGEACYEALEELICTQAPLLSVFKLMCLQVRCTFFSSNVTAVSTCYKLVCIQPPILMRALHSTIRTEYSAACNVC